MRRTLNEVYRLCQKAAEGASAPAGLDIDAARNSAWLVARGFAVLGSLATQLEGATGGDACAFTAGEIGAKTLDAAGRPGALLAPALVDLLIARAEDRSGRLVVSGLSVPVYLLAAAMTHRWDEWCFRFVLSNGGARGFVLEASASGASVLGPAGAAVSHLSTGVTFDVIAHCAPTVDALPPPPPLETLITRDDFAETKARSLSNGVDVDPEAWQRLQRLAVKVLVPATENSRLRGAGYYISDRASASGPKSRY